MEGKANSDSFLAKSCGPAQTPNPPPPNICGEHNPKLQLSLTSPVIGKHFLDTLYCQWKAADTWNLSLESPDLSILQGQNECEIAAGVAAGGECDAPCKGRTNQWSEGIDAL